MKLIVKAKKLNKRSTVPAYLPDPNGIIGTVLENFQFEGEEVPSVPNPGLGKWYRDRDNSYYWGGALEIAEEPIDEYSIEYLKPDNNLLDAIPITSPIKRKIEQVVNVFETGKKEGDYAQVTVYADYTDPGTGNRIKQVTYGRSQTTEFGHLKALLQEYIANNGSYGHELAPFLNQLGRKPSLENNTVFCDLLRKAGKEDPVMKLSQDQFFDGKYYTPAFQWFTTQAFSLPLSMLVIYDSFIHSGSILSFLRKKFPTPVPANGGDEKEWISHYVLARHHWLSNHREPLLRLTAYRTTCFRELIADQNWKLTRPINANGTMIL